MQRAQEESLRRILSRMKDSDFTRQEVIDTLKETGTPKIPEIEKLVNEYFPEATW